MHCILKSQVGHPGLSFPAVLPRQLPALKYKAHVLARQCEKYVCSPTREIGGRRYGDATRACTAKTFISNEAECPVPLNITQLSQLGSSEER